MDDRDIRSDSKMKGDALTEEQHQELWELRYPAGEDDPLSLEVIAATEVPRICSITCAVSTLSGYYKWARRRRRIRDARESAEQAKLELLAMEPESSEEQLDAYAQLVFKSEAIETGDAKTYAMMQRVKIAEIKAENDTRKIAILEATAKKANEAEAVTKDEKLTAEEKQARLKSIFGIG